MDSDLASSVDLQIHLTAGMAAGTRLPNVDCRQAVLAGCCLCMCDVQLSVTEDDSILGDRESRSHTTTRQEEAQNPESKTPFCIFSLALCMFCTTAAGKEGNM